MSTGDLAAGFECHRPQTRDDVESSLRGALLSLDANVLLDFYRYTPSAREGLVDVLRAAGDRLFVSHQAAREFWRNRLHRIDDRGTANDQLNEALDTAEKRLVDAVKAWAKQTAAGTEVSTAVQAVLKAALDSARDKVEEEMAQTATIAYDASRDTVAILLEDLLANAVGPPLAADAHAAAVAEGNKRAAEGSPPGYKDAGKIDAGNPDGAAGDYLVWKQSMLEAERRGLDLAVITSDEKEDWWWRHRGAFLGPRTELFTEFAETTGRSFYLLRPVDLTEHAGALKVTVSDAARNDVERASAMSAGWTSDAVHELLRRLDAGGYPQAEVIRFAASEGGSSIATTSIALLALLRIGCLGASPAPHHGSRWSCSGRDF